MATTGTGQKPWKVSTEKRLDHRGRFKEENLQMVIADYLARFCPVLWWHVPNGNKLANKRAGGRLKRMGVKAGVHDLHFLLPGGILGTVELKVKPNGLTPEQRYFKSRVEEGGGRAAVCYSLGEVIDVLAAWGVTTGARLTPMGRA